MMSKVSEKKDGYTSSLRTSNSPQFVLPPIISSESDRNFLIDINIYIDDELGKAKDRYNPEQRYTVYKSAFDQVIDFVTAYKPLLTAVKAEYEECIDIICRGQKEAFFLSGKLKAMASEPSTIRNYRKRIDELEQRSKLIQNENDDLKMQLQMLQARREEREKKQQQVNDPPVREIKRDRRNIPGLTTEESTDLKRLLKEKEKLERQFRELNITHRTRYAPKYTQDELKEKLAMKVLKRDKLIEDTEYLKLKQKKLKTAVEAAQAYMKIQPPHQTIGDAVVMALVRQGTASVTADKGEDGNARGTPSTTFEEDDPTREKEAEMMLEYIEKFNELLEDSKFEEAAVHAANSPKGILRTPETLQRFKDIRHEKTSQGRSPLLAFSDALMSSVAAFGSVPSEFLTVESIQVALDENRLDLVSHWISQERVCMTGKLGDLLHCFSKSRSHQTGKICLALAQKVYTECKDHLQAMKCMIEQNRVTQAVEYGRKNSLKAGDFVELLKSNNKNAVTLASCLYDVHHPKNSVLPLGVLAWTLVECGKAGQAATLLQGIQALGGASDAKSSKTPLYRAVTEDKVTGTEQWHHMVGEFTNEGYQELGYDILGILTLQGIIQNAAENASKVEEELAAAAADEAKEERTQQHQEQQQSSADADDAGGGVAENDNNVSDNVQNNIENYQEDENS